MMNACKWVVLLCVGFALCCTPFGCGHVPIPRVLDDEKIIVIPKITLHIRPTKQGLPIEHSIGVARMEGKNNYHIYMFGSKIRGKFSLSSIVLGHEVRHILQFIDPENFINPDTGR